MDYASAEQQPREDNMNLKLSPSLRVALKAVLSDTIQEFSMLHRAALQKISVFKTPPFGNKSSIFERRSDSLIKELSKIFFEALVKFENCRREDFITLPDGSFQKLTDENSTLRTILMESEIKMDVLKNTESEIDLYGTFKSLKAYCDDRQAIVDMQADLAKKIMANDRQIRLLQDKLSVMEENFAKQVVFHDEIISQLKHEWHETRHLKIMSYEYLNSSYEQRAEYYSRLFDYETGALLNEAQSYRQSLNREKRIMQEKLSCMLAELDSHANRLRYLQGQTAVQDLSKNIDIMVKSLEQLRSEHEKLKNEYTQCERVILDYEAAQERARLEDEFDQKTLVAIFQIQAWWRTMVVVRGIKVKATKRGRKS